MAPNPADDRTERSSAPPGATRSPRRPGATALLLPALLIMAGLALLLAGAARQSGSEADMASSAAAPADAPMADLPTVPAPAQARPTEPVSATPQPVLPARWDGLETYCIGQILENGHELGNHSYTHDNMLGMPESIIRWELGLTEQLTQEAYPGATTKPIFRAPFGAITDTVVQVSNSEGYHLIGWTVDSRDWTDDITADAIYQRVVDHVCPGAIIAFHDVNPANAAALPRLLDYLEGSGYQFVTVSEILSP